MTSDKIVSVLLPGFFLNIMLLPLIERMLNRTEACKTEDNSRQSLSNSLYITSFFHFLVLDAAITSIMSKLIMIWIVSIKEWQHIKSNTQTIALLKMKLEVQCSVLVHVDNEKNNSK